VPLYVSSPDEKTFHSNSVPGVSSKVADALYPFFSTALDAHPLLADFTFKLVVHWNDVEMSNVPDDKVGIGREVLKSRTLRAYNRTRAKEVVNKLDENGVEASKGLELYCFKKNECVDFEGALVLMVVRNASRS
jgi:hypothetical protein